MMLKQILVDFLQQSIMVIHLIPCMYYEYMYNYEKKRLMGISNVMSPTLALLQHLKSLQKW